MYAFRFSFTIVLTDEGAGWIAAVLGSLLKIGP